MPKMSRLPKIKYLQTKIRNPHSKIRNGNTPVRNVLAPPLQSKILNNIKILDL